MFDVLGIFLIVAGFTLLVIAIVEWIGSWEWKI